MPRPHTHLAQYSAQEVVVACKALAHEHLGHGARVQQTLVGGPEEALIGVEP